MTEESLKNIIDQEDVCRCCLSTTGTWDLTATYTGTGEIKEVFFDMLRECCGITLAHIPEEGLSHFICNICLVRLREACHFREQVLRAERQFIHFYNQRKEKHELNEIKLEIKEELPDDIDINQSSPTDAGKEMEIKMDTEQKVAEPTQKPCIIITKRTRQLNMPTDPTKQNKSCVIITKCRRKINQSSMSSSSEKLNNAHVITTKCNKSQERDIPVTKPLSINSGEMQTKESGNNSKIEDLDDDDKGKTPFETPPLITEKDLMMTVVDNDWLRMNMAQMLKYSTVVPFRYLQNTNSRYTCQYCKENYLIFSQLKQHFDEKHANVTNEEIEASLRSPFSFVKAEISDIRCKLCREHFLDLDTLSEHLVETHQKQYYELKIKPSHGVLGFIFKSEKLECHLCNKDFHSFRTLFSHMSQHFENFECKPCGKKFFCDRLFKCHLRRHQNVQYKCKFCDKTFSNGGVRANHMRKEHSYGMFKCSECGDTFDQNRLRVDHLVKVHNLEKRRFYCDICSKDFSSSGTLREHIRKHKVDQQYVCEICGKRCTARTGMQIHMRVHSGERPYKCKFCDKKFATGNTLRLHVRGHQNDKRFVCEVCGAAFIQKHCLKRHYRVRHPDSWKDLSHSEAKNKMAT